MKIEPASIFSASHLAVRMGRITLSDCYGPCYDR
jgi:hypothetical protein